jgi:hypothetical protein
MTTLELETRIVGHRIDITSPALPDFAERARIIVELPDAPPSPAHRQEGATLPSQLMRLSLAERRRILAEQAARLEAHYAAENRQDWQAGEFIDAD